MKAAAAEATASIGALNADKEVLTNEMKELKDTTANMLTEIKNIKEMTVGGETVVAKAHIKPESKTETPQASGLGAWGKTILKAKA